jgi:sialidase-1
MNVTVRWLFVCSTSLISIAGQASATQHVDVFVPEQDGYPAIRIPALVQATDGTLLAFAEGRQGGDHSDNVLLLKRSRDGGSTWSRAMVLDQQEGLALNNPQAVVLADGRILLLYQSNRLGERAAPAGYGPDAYSVWLLASDDHGASWLPPRDITRQTRRESSTSVASGPGVGIQLQSQKYRGRIVMPMNEGPYGSWQVYAVFSDDGGESWQMGEPAPAGDQPGFANEVQMVELSSGALLLNARNMGGKACRKQARSEDGGMTWSPLEDQPELVDPECQAALGYWPERDLLLFLNPASPRERIGGALRTSKDHGYRWSASETIWPGPFAYSCLTLMADGRLGVLFERDGYAAISFLSLDLAELFPVPPEREDDDNRKPRPSTLRVDDWP